MVVLVNPMGVRRTADYLTEGTLSVFPPKFWHRSTGLGFNNERSHDRGRSVTVSTVQSRVSIYLGQPRGRTAQISQCVVVTAFEEPGKRESRDGDGRADGLV